MNKKVYSNIKNLSDLQEQKKLLKSRMRLRKKLIDKHVSDLSDDFSGDYLLRQSMKLLKIDNNLTSFIPEIIANQKIGKKIIFPLIGGIVSFFGAYMLFKKKKNPEHN
jgi:uncharacterized protein YggL (DUF469 family)